MVGVVGSGPAAERAADAVPTAATAPADDAAAVLETDPDAVVAVGEDAVLALVRAGVDVPVLPVAEADADPDDRPLGGVQSVPGAAVAAAAERVADGDFERRSLPLLSVSAEGGPDAAPAVMDAMVVTERPATISEYAVRSVDDGGVHFDVARFRADGVVVAGPAGSHGYARAAGGPLLGPGVRSAAVVPVAPFAIDRPHWVLDLPVTLSVERDESDVALLVDDREYGPLPPDAETTVDWGDSLAIAVVPESESPFGGG